MNKLRASVIIPNYNGYELLSKNLQSVMDAMKNAKNNIKEIIVVDDASNDGSVDYIKKNYSEIKLIRHKVNRGFSAAVNTGARSATGELLVLLNSDVIPKIDFLIPVIPIFKDEIIFAVSLHESGYGWAKGIFIDGFISHEGGSESKDIHDTFWVSGGSGVFRRDIWMQLGGMDEKLLSPFYWEDVDLSYRAVKRGRIVVWCPDSYVLHRHESTVKKISKKYRQRIQERNQLIFIWKNLTSPILFRKHIFSLFKRVSMQPGYIRIIVMSLIRLKGIIRARKIELKEGKISDEAIFSKFKNV